MNKNYVTLKDVCEKASSSIAQKDLLGHDGIFPIYGASGFIKNVDFYKQEKEYIAIVKDGAGIGRAMKLPAHSSVIGTMQYIIPKENVNISYLYYAICAMHLEKYFSGATIPHIYFKDYQKEKLYLPSLGEQEKIASIFEKLEWLIANKKKQLDNLGLLVQSRFIEMFGDVRGNPYNWPVKAFKDMTELITDGEHATPQRTNQGIYLLSARNILNHKFNLSDVDYISQKEYDRISSRVIPQEGDVLISCSGTIGRCCTVPTGLKFQMVRSVALLRFKREIEPRFAEYLITSSDLQRQIDRSKTTSTQANLFQGKISKLQGFIPPKELQEQFVSIANKIDKSKYRGEKSWHLLYVFYKKAMNMI